jgi:hypothetical protein
MVVKAMGLPEVTNIGLFAEYFGAMLATEFGVLAPEPAIVHFSPDFVEAAAPDLQRWGLSPRPGDAVGVEYLRGLAPISSLIPAKGPDELADALHIYALDMLIQNPDRRIDKPNCANHRGRLLAYDHEMAFSFLYPIVDAGKPWVVPSFCRQHLFWRSLHTGAVKGDMNWGSVRTNLATLNSRVEALAQSLPDRWAEFGATVVRHVHDVADHAQEFEGQLRGSLQ